MAKGKRVKGRSNKDYSKVLVGDIRSLLWIVTVGGIGLAAMCIYKGYTGSLPWLSAMVDYRGRHMVLYALFI